MLHHFFAASCGIPFERRRVSLESSAFAFEILLGARLSSAMLLLRLDDAKNRLPTRVGGAGSYWPEALGK